MEAAPSPLQLQEHSEDIRAEVGLEGVELEEVSELPLEEVLAEVLGWKGFMAALEITGRGLE